MKRGLQAIIATLFVVSLWVPIICTTLGCKELVQIREVRQPTTRPVLSLDNWSDYPDAFCDYFADTFAYRISLASVFGLAKVKVFHVSPTDRVLLGKDHWLFYTGSRKIEDFQGLCPPTTDQLALWRTWIGGRGAWLAARGIAYKFVQVPNKISIYPQEVPDSIRRKGPATRLDVLAAFLQSQQMNNYLDLRPALRTAGHNQIVYYEAGTHWNHLGAYAAYTTLCEALRDVKPGLQPLGLDKFTIGEWPGEAICRMMCIRDEDFGVPAAPCLKVREVRARHVKTRLPDNFPSGNYSFLATECDGASGTLLVLHDSFFVDFMRRVLPEHFSRTYWLRVNGSMDHASFGALIDAFHPDVVIEERVERFMAITPDRDPAYVEALASAPILTADH